MACQIGRMDCFAGWAGWPLHPDGAGWVALADSLNLKLAGWMTFPDGLGVFRMAVHAGWAGTWLATNLSV